MNQESLHAKIIEMAKRNKKGLNALGEHLSHLKKEAREQQNGQLLSYRREYENLVRLSQESEEQTLRLRRQLVQADIEIEEVEIKNTMSRSRIKLQSEEIDNIRDETYDVDKQRRREEKREKYSLELKLEAEALQEEVNSLEGQFEQRSKSIAELQGRCQALIEKKENLNHARKESHKKHKTKVEELEQQLRQLKNQANGLRVRKEREEEKTKRNNNNQKFMQILSLLRNYKEGASD